MTPAMRLAPVPIKEGGLSAPSLNLDLALGFDFMSVLGQGLKRLCALSSLLENLPGCHTHWKNQEKDERPLDQSQLGIVSPAKASNMCKSSQNQVGCPPNLQ